MRSFTGVRCALLLLVAAVTACGLTTQSVEDRQVTAQSSGAGGTTSAGPKGTQTGTISGERSGGDGADTARAGAATTARAGAAAKGGDGGEPTVTSEAGQPADGGAPAVVAVGNCFEFLGNGLRCEGAEAHAQGRHLERVDAATNLAECEDACLERSDCLAVSDYFDAQPFPQCALNDEPCPMPGTGDWQEEDAGKEYRRVCPDAGICHLEYLGDWVRCSDDGGGQAGTITTSFADCQAACLNNPDCTGITDYFYLGDVAGCYIYTSTCNAPKALPFGDTGKAYVRGPCK